MRKELILGMRSRPKALWVTATAVLTLVTAGVLWIAGREAQDPLSRAEADEMTDRAASLIADKDYAAARQLLNSVLHAHPEHGVALLYKGQLLREQGDLLAALAEWRRVSNHPPTIEGTARFLEGSALLALNRAREAERALRCSVELHPTYLQPRELLLGLHDAQMRRPEIISDLAGIARLRELMLRELVLWVVAGEPAAPPEPAIVQLQKFLAEDPADLESRIALARYHLVEGEPQKAEQLLRDASGTDQANDARVRAVRSEAFLRNEQFGAAREALGPWPPAAESHELLWRSFGLYWTDIGDWRRAAESFARFARANPYNLTAEYQFGTALQRLGQNETAARHLQRAEQLDRLRRHVQRLSRGDHGRKVHFAEVVAHVGALTEELGRDRDALAWFRQALLLDPRNRIALARYRSLRQKPALANAAPSYPDLDDLREGNAVTLPAASPPPAGEAEESVATIRVRDVHAEAGLDFQYFTGETGYKYLLETAGGGVGVLDYDADGWPDLYFPQGCRLPCDPDDFTYTDHLCRNRGDGRFESVAAKAGIAENRYSQGCAAGDYDGDGFPDLFVANYGRNTLCRNNGDGTFTDVTVAAGLTAEQMSSSLALADLNRDGHLDLYVVNYVESLKVCADQDGRISTCDPQFFAGEQDSPYLNAGDGRFLDVTQTSGIVAPDGKGLGIVAADLDDDGWTDLYIANDGTPNFFFRNLGGQTTRHSPLTTHHPSPVRFVEQGLSAGCALNGDGKSEAGMGIACADLDQDGRLDLYVTNFYQEQNTLYRNMGGGLFEDATRTAGLREPTLPLLGFGTQAADLDLDGRPELFVANGHIDDFRARGEPLKMRPQLFRNLGRGRFEEMTVAGAGSQRSPGDSGTTHQSPLTTHAPAAEPKESPGAPDAYLAGEYLGRGVARLDWNRDGRPDLVVVHHDRPVALLTNETERPGTYLHLTLRGTRSNRDAIGARVTVRSGDRTWVHELCGGDGYMASNERNVLVGLGGSDLAESLHVRWPSGEEQFWTDLPAEARLVLVEGRSQPTAASTVSPADRWRLPHLPRPAAAPRPGRRRTL